MNPGPTRNYIGLANSPHDTALAIVDSKGRVVFAEGGERHLQNKRAWCAPPDDLMRAKTLLRRYCEPGADLVVSTTWSDSFLHGMRFMLLNPLMQPLVRRLLPDWRYLAFRSMLAASSPFAGLNLQAQFSGLSPRGRFIRKSFDHHLTHAAAACYSSPFREALCVIVDGYGEFSTTAVFHYKEGRLERLRQFKRSPRSLGFFYADLCWACGFDSVGGEEWKVMGLAPYGKKDPELCEILHSILQVAGRRFVAGSDEKGGARRLFARMRPPETPPLASAGLAFTGQQVFCELMAKYLEGVYETGLSGNLVLGGGCALNSACVGRLPELTSFKHSHVFCAPADDGNAVGAALLAYYGDHPGEERAAETQSPYLGSEMAPLSLEHLAQYGGLNRARLEPGETVTRRVAGMIAQGKIVGWVQGRAEFGPRALGNRSILADPRSPTVKERLNAEVKYREEFRPFAPSILHEHGPAYFENYVETPYMERALVFRPEVRSRVPGVVHVDGTGRLQTVKREWNERYYDLISAFHEITGVPILLNTSFNVMGKPIIHSVEDAVAVFLTSGLDALALGDHLYEKRPSG